MLDGGSPLVQRRRHRLSPSNIIELTMTPQRTYNHQQLLVSVDMKLDAKKWHHRSLENTPSSDSGLLNDICNKDGSVNGKVTNNKSKGHQKSFSVDYIYYKVAQKQHQLDVSPVRHNKTALKKEPMTSSRQSSSFKRSVTFAAFPEEKTYHRKEKSLARQFVKRIFGERKRSRTPPSQASIRIDKEDFTVHSEILLKDFSDFEREEEERYSDDLISTSNQSCSDGMESDNKLTIPFSTPKIRGRLSREELGLVIEERSSSLLKSNAKNIETNLRSPTHPRKRNSTGLLEDFKRDIS